MVIHLPNLRGLANLLDLSKHVGYVEHVATEGTRPANEGPSLACSSTPKGSGTERTEAPGAFASGGHETERSRLCLKRA